MFVLIKKNVKRLIFINKLQVDNREDKVSKKIFKYLDDAKIEYEVAQLTIGDYRLPNGEIVERKSLMDFVQSYISHHLQNQLDSMDLNLERYYVFISGKYNYFDFQNRNLPYITENVISKMCLHLLQNYPKLRIVYFPNDKALIEIGIKELLTYKGQRFKETYIKKQQRKEDIVASMLTCIPGVGLKRATEIVAICPTLDNLRISIAERNPNLFNIKGISEKKLLEILTYI